MSVTTHPAVADYVARIHAELADLPAAEVEEIVDDIGQHLAEIAAELGEEVSVEALTERLGTPEQYASELRAAAGYPPAPGASPTKRGVFAARVAVWGLVIGVVDAFLAGGVVGALGSADALGGAVLFSLPLLIAILLVFTGTAPMSTIVELAEYRAIARTWRRAMDGLPDPVATYLRSLRPAWWLIRILVLVVALLLALRRDQATSGAFVLLPLLGIVLLLWFGKRARTDGRWRWIIAPTNLFAFGVGLALVSLLWRNTGVYTAVYYMPPPDGVYNQGRYVDNLYVFGPDGKPLPEVYLYDQDGRAIALLGRKCGEVLPPTNKVPVPRFEYDSTGCHEVSGVPFTIVLPQPNPPSTSAPPTK